MDVEEMRNVHKILVGKPKGRRPLGINRRRLEDNIRIHMNNISGHV
jgi:hypothetical protein